MVAVSVGIACERSGRLMEDGTKGVDSMRPVTTWWVVEV